MTVKTSDLDFASIKSSLKAHLQQQSEFADYDFEASGLSRILDVLAYNTHINGLTANMAVNESFLGSSQLRSSVLSHAEALGYTPKSKTSAAVTINATVSIPSGPDTITIPAGSVFTGDVDDTTYIFTNLNPASASNISGTYTLSIPVVEGSIKTKTFAVGNELDVQTYVIPDKKIDISTLRVVVYDNFTNVDVFDTYYNINNVATIDDDSRVYMIREASNGYYEMFFGDGNILGKAPVAGNKIEISYVVSNGSLANGADTFTGPTIEFEEEFYQMIIPPTSPSAGGSEKESISSIKLNAPRGYTTQNRLVTADDYRAMILKNYSTYIRDAVTWGGNDNIPPQYGKVFISLNYRDGVSEEVKTQQETQITNQLLSNLSIMSIDAVFIRPEETFLELQTVFNLDASQTSTTVEQMKAIVNSTIQTYMLSDLSNFDSVFRRSNLLTRIDGISPAILNSRMTVKMQQRINMDQIIADVEGQLEANGVLPEDFDDYIEQDHSIYFPVMLADPDKDDHIVTSSVFKTNGQNVLIKNKLGSTQLQLLDVDNVVKIANVGYYEPANGKVYLNALRIDKVGYVGTGVKISATPANQSTIRPLRNYIITYDSGASSTQGFVDYGATKVLL
jgi:hypothetical protein